MPRFMSAIPIITILTLLPLVGGILIIGLGSEKKQLARWLGLIFSFAALGLVVLLWSQFKGASGSFSLLNKDNGSLTRER